ncbi:hypothetical protein C8258_02550 [Nocardia sp. MDA0666]|nr:hypothetical protein C8258_02550 [Nocardia sp. MDA0666]
MPRRRIGQPSLDSVEDGAVRAVPVQGLPHGTAAQSLLVRGVLGIADGLDVDRGERSRMLGQLA